MQKKKNLAYHLKFAIAENTSLLAGQFAAKDQLEKPIFVVGTGRCGSSLLVKILDTHRNLAGFPGEANNLWHPKYYPFEKVTEDVDPIEMDAAEFTNRSIQSWPENYDVTLRRIFSGYHMLRGRGRTFFVKSAMISFLVPKIAEMFPDARFIHVYRNGPSVVRSFTEKNLTRYPRHHFEKDEYRLIEAKYWNDCILELDKQSRRYDDESRFIELSYEDLCDDPRKELSRLTNAFGLGMDDFGFDLSTIKSTNHKVGEYHDDEAWTAPLAAMESGMRLKGYIQG